MRGLTSSCIVVFLLLTSVEGFTTKKREQGHPFQSVNVASEEKKKKSQQESVPGTSPAAPLFALPPSSAVSYIPVIYEDELEEDINISYGVALVSCALSLALGFGFGYGV